MMVIFFEQIYINNMPIQQVLSKNKLGQIFVLGPHLLRKLVNVQKSNALKKLCLEYFFKSDTKFEVLKKRKTSRCAFLKNV